MNNPRIYGNPPYHVALLHGGPGAPGGMAPVACELAPKMGVLEPLQTADSVAGQVQELHTLLTASTSPPVTLVGSSWGALLGFIFAAQHPAWVEKLILIGSAVFSEKYAPQIMQTRLSRLSPAEKAEVDRLQKILVNPEIPEKDTALAGLGQIFTRTDASNPFTLETGTFAVQFDLHVKVWQEAVVLRKRGALLKMGKKIKCPVVALHGDYDPHPAEGVREPLTAVLKHFEFILLPKCGHLPWIEREARSLFFETLLKQLPVGF